MNAIDKIMGRKTEETKDETQENQEESQESQANQEGSNTQDKNTGSETKSNETSSEGQEGTETNTEDSDVPVCVECDSTDLTHRKSGLIICNSCKHINRSALDEESV